MSLSTRFQVLIRITMYFLFFLSFPTPTEIYTLSLHDALPISSKLARSPKQGFSRLPISWALGGRAKPACQPIPVRARAKDYRVDAVLGLSSHTLIYRYSDIGTSIPCGRSRGRCTGGGASGCGRCR